MNDGQNPITPTPFFHSDPHLIQLVPFSVHKSINLAQMIKDSPENYYNSAISVDCGYIL
jgi:hypothetical protein